MALDLHPAKAILNHFSQAFPDVWRLLEVARQEASTPEWCWLPMGRAGVMLQHYPELTQSFLKNNASRFVATNILSLATALFSWRATQGIYRFDPDLYAALIDTELDGSLPVDLLYRLPAWCIYIETPGLAFGGTPFHGCWVHLELDQSGRRELRFVLNAEGETIPVVLHLDESLTLAQSLESVADEIRKQEKAAGINFAAFSSSLMSRCFGEVLPPLLALVLYLCSEAPDVPVAGMSRPTPTKTKRGLQYFPPNTSPVWDVGVRIGAVLRRAHEHLASDGSGSHGSPRPHIRRAHWHGFRSGAMKTATGEIIPVEKRRFDLRWMPPIPVNTEIGDALPAVVRRVKS